MSGRLYEDEDSLEEEEEEFDSAGQITEGDSGMLPRKKMRKMTEAQKIERRLDKYVLLFNFTLFNVFSSIFSR